MVKIDECDDMSETFGLCIPEKGRVTILQADFDTAIMRARDSPTEKRYVIYALTDKSHRHDVAKAVDGKIYNTNAQTTIPVIEIDERVTDPHEENEIVAKLDKVMHGELKSPWDD